MTHQQDRRTTTETRHPPVKSMPERITGKPAEQQGIFRKFDVSRVDGSDGPGGKHEGCEYFVLDVDHDPHAAAALRAYAASCADTHPELARELMGRWGEPKLNPYEEAVIDQLVVAHIYNETHDHDARKAVDDLISYHVDVALDPSVSAAAEALVSRGRVEGQL